MSQTLRRDESLDRHVPVSTSRPFAVPERATALRAQPTTETSIWRRLERARMSQAERSAAVAALMLGNDIGRTLLRIERVLRAWVTPDADRGRARHASLHHVIRMRRARLYRRTKPARTRGRR
jgi:hypothetical protein